jgi:hypothetical protein
MCPDLQISTSVIFVTVKFGLFRVIIYTFESMAYGLFFFLNPETQP